MTRRREYPRHSNDAFDRFLTERSRGADGHFSIDKMRELAASLDIPDGFIPEDGNNGTRRMTFGINLRNYFSAGEIAFRDGTKLQLDLEEDSR